MAEHTRRTFLKSASLGTAVVGAVALAPGFLGTAAAAPAGPEHDGPFVAWVKDAKTGTIAVMVGEREVLHQDRELAARLARIAAGHSAS